MPKLQPCPSCNQTLPKNCYMLIVCHTTLLHSIVAYLGFKGVTELSTAYFWPLCQRSHAINDHIYTNQMLMLLPLTHTLLLLPMNKILYIKITIDSWYWLILLLYFCQADDMMLICCWYIVAMMLICCWYYVDMLLIWCWYWYAIDNDMLLIWYWYVIDILYHPTSDNDPSIYTLPNCT